jgi:LysR family hydrogen peroxide-inducible transcriptional activator
VELNQLQCFIAVLEEGGFKRATARLGITQPALSYQIKRLEEELGVQVFRRGPGGITPTEAGRVLLDHAHHVMTTVREAHQAVRELSGGVSGEIRVGAIKCVGSYFLPRVLWEVRARHPMVRPKILYRDSDELFEALLANRLDVAMVVDPPPDRRMRHDRVFDEMISLVSGPGHRFYGRPTVGVAELQEVEFVALSPQTSAGGLIRAYLDRLGLTIVPSVSTDNVETVKRMVEVGMGVAFLPDMATADDVADDGRPGRLWRSAVEPSLSLPLVLVSWRDTHHSLALDAFIEVVCRVGRRWDGALGRPAPEDPAVERVVASPPRV